MCSSDLGAFTIADTRSFEQDARFGFVVLAEIATRALSPGVNDAGTAIDVIGRLERLLWLFGANAGIPETPRHPRVRVPRVEPADLVRDAYAAVARDGAGKLEVALRLQEALARLARSGDAELAEAARRMSAHALDHAEAALALEDERGRLRRAAAAAAQR